MASILDKYGIKEVADVTFYHLNQNGDPDYPVLYLDTLKVSTIEQTAEQTEARGGKGNPPLIIWDYGKEINVTLEDALFSAKSMAIMFGDGATRSVATDTSVTGATNGLIMRTEELVLTSALTATTAPATDTASIGNPIVANATAATAYGWNEKYIANGVSYTKQHPRFYYEDNRGEIVVLPTNATPIELPAGSKVFVTYDLILAKGAGVIEISASTFPGTYYVTGDTYARSSASGEDEFFQFIIPKAKMNAENTITLEAEGDPSVFNMSLRVMRPDDGVMMKLVKYDLADGTRDAASLTSDLVHNHDL